MFVSFGDNYSGLVHISEISDRYVKNICDYVNLDEVIKVKVLAVDDDNHHLKLSIKNFDYRINKRSRSNIVETTLGFTTLQRNLNGWVRQKKEELEKTIYNYD